MPTDVKRSADSTGRRRADRFARIYATNEWNGAESRSGRGSDISATHQVVRILDAAIILTRAETLLDAGCGERHWLRSVRAPIRRYIAVDIVAEAFKRSEVPMPAHWPAPEFICADIVSDPLPSSDLILCRDVLPHLSYRDVAATVRTMRDSGARYLLTTSFSHRENADIETGLWRPLNLEAPPFDFPPPMKRWSEECPLDGGKFADKCLDLWPLESLSHL